MVERVDWDCEVVRDFADENLGLKRRIPSGLDRVFSEAEEAIILEDDCLPHPSFFPYCEELLERYRDDERIVHIAGSQLLQSPPADASYHFSRYPHVWGWASWRRAWDLYDVDLTDWHSDSEAERRDRLRRMFEEEDERRYWGWVWDHSPEIDNWDAQWSYVGLSRGLLSINPNRNLISNIGFSDDATNATADPLGIAGRPLEGIDFPLEHPPAVEPRRAGGRACLPLLQAPGAADLAPGRGAACGGIGPLPSSTFRGWPRYCSGARRDSATGSRRPG